MGLVLLIVLILLLAGAIPTGGFGVGPAVPGALTIVLIIILILLVLGRI
jgi:hypothetical protein